MSVPADPYSHLSPEMCPSTAEEQQEMSRTPYLEAIGSLLHLSNLTRCDIAFAVGQASRYSNNPGKAHWNAVKRIIAYLKQTVNFGIMFSEGHEECHELFGYCDSDYASDLQTRKSTSGFVFLLWGAPISWASKRQACVALSTTEAEVIALVEAAKEAVWLRRFIRELGFPEQTVPLFCDNQSAISLIRNLVLHSRVKHMSVRLSGHHTRGSGKRHHQCELHPHGAADGRRIHQGPPAIEIPISSGEHRHQRVSERVIRYGEGI